VDWVVEHGTLLATGFYMAGSKMVPCSQVGDNVPGSGVNAFDPVLCD